MNLNGPAEVPPLSFKGRQYVDSAGCVFVRAGYGGNVNWVPRVDRTKNQLCGYTPTLKGNEPVIDIAKVAPAPATTPVAAAATPTGTAAPTAVATSAPVKPSKSPFEPTPFVGKPMETIATTEAPPRIGLGVAAAPRPVAAPARVPSPAPVQVAAAPVVVAVAPPAPAPVIAPTPAAMPTRSGYVSPYALNGGMVASTPAPAPVAPPVRGSVRYHNTLPVPVQIVGTETVAATATSCPAGTSAAQRYLLSDGRSVVRCGGAAANPEAFINAAAVPGLVVGSAPMVGGTGYGPSAYDASAYPVTTTAPMVGGTGYGVSYSTQAMTTVSGGMTPQQAYATASPYRLNGGTVAVPQTAGRVSSNSYTPPPVYVRSPSGQSTLTPIEVATDAGPTGYAPAFDDGRLNPFRGPRTAMGDAQQGVLWTNEVPARPVTAKTPARKRIVPAEPVYVAAPAYAVPYAPVASRVSSKSVVTPVAPAPQAAGPRYVQVGTFAMPGNAEAAKARLAAAGLPVSSAQTGRGLVVVLAGPFADARQALATVRGAGFADVILR
ncbi:SPOR domain-containing protein [Rhodobacter viridis]|nr:SPOR domain-containing protein [Rhodobacter viridis]